MAYVNEKIITDPVEKKEVQQVLDAIHQNNKTGYWAVKRFLDVTISFCALLVLFIPMAIIALIIFLSDGHHPFFAQTRVGRFGKEFKMYKFRTMVPNAEELKAQLESKNEMTGPVFKMADDPRITKIGKFLRKTSIDELPQFYNVLKGDMTIIGPRPPLPSEVAQYSEFHKIRLIVTPGITCIWQTTPNRNSIDFEDWVKMDIDYVVNRTVFMDIKIIFRTVYVMFCGEGE
ncbi:MAG: sugar transferase [Eubacteriales bacterium]|nr:sugar transferase [Eubacteriales bacterium]